MGAAMLLSISFQYTFSDWSKQKVVAVQKCVISIDEEIVNPHDRSRVYIEQSRSETLDLGR